MKRVKQTESTWSDSSCRRGEGLEHVGGLPLPEGRGPSVWADSRCRRGEGMEHVGGLPLPEGRGPGL